MLSTLLKRSRTKAVKTQTVAGIEQVLEGIMEDRGYRNIERILKSARHADWKNAPRIEMIVDIADLTGTCVLTIVQCMFNHISIVCCN